MSESSGSAGMFPVTVDGGVTQHRRTDDCTACWKGFPCRCSICGARQHAQFFAGIADGYALTFACEGCGAQSNGPPPL